MARLGEDTPVDDFLDLEDQASQASSTYGEEDAYDDLIRNYEAQPCTQRVPLASSSNPSNNSSGSLQIPPASTQSSSRTKSSFSTSFSIEFGKRKASELLASEQPSSKRRIVLDQRLRDPLAKGKPTFKGGSVDPNEPVINSPPQIMAALFSSLPYGAQFELARFVNDDQIKFEDVSMALCASLRNLKSNVAAAPQVAKFVAESKGRVVPLQNQFGRDPFARLFEKENRARNPWEELDKEEEALAKDPHGAMGYNADGSPSDWCGGQVQFRGPSSQLTRRFGSKFFFRIKISKTAQRVDSEELLNYLRRPLIICGSVFRSFYAKDDNIFLFRTNETWDRGCVTPASGKSDGLSLLDFINWHNPIYMNENQAMAKWASRFSLGLSNSAPGYLLSRESIKFMDDIVNPVTKANMTDGAGSLNRCLVRQLRHRYDWNERPSAFQVRVHGGKGLLIEDIVDHSESPIIILTPSQIKIKYPVSDTDPSHYAVDVLRASHLKTPCRLSAETIVNLGENGVPRASFVTLLEASLKEAVDPFLSWDDLQALRELWVLVQRRGGVISSRRAREQPGIARLKGWSERDLDENENDDEDGFTQLDSAEQRSSAWWADPISGCPSSLAETVMYLLDSGFQPQTCPVLREKLKNVVKGYVRQEIRSYHFEVPMSATAFITPDRSGILADGEVFLKSSSRNLMLADGTYTDILLGDVLLARYPCKLPTDIQKWKAVDRPELHHLADVIVLPTNGPRRAADWLSGGDYDGDKAIIMWQPELVIPFRNANAQYADPPEDMDRFFEKEVESASDFVKKISAQTTSTSIIHLYQYHLLGAVRNTSVVGMYSKFHDNAVYTRGYTDPTTRRLAFMFCMTLDGAKTGLSVKPDVFDKDRKEFGHRPPVWKESEEEREKNQKTNDRHPVRRGLHTFIMDDLHKEADKQGDIWLKKIEDKFLAYTNQNVDDSDLMAPYNEAVRKSLEPAGGDLYVADLKLIRKHVEDLYKEYEAQVRRDQGQRRDRESTTSPRKLKSPKNEKTDSAGFTELRIEDRQDILRALSRKFAMRPDSLELHMLEDTAARVKASYAFVYDCQTRRRSATKWSRFPWDVAFRQLCDIKARASGNHKTVSGEFYDHMVVKIPKYH